MKKPRQLVVRLRKVRDSLKLNTWLRRKRPTWASVQKLIGTHFFIAVLSEEGL